MYNRAVTTSDHQMQMDSKYTVADILSSMANGEPVSSSNGYANYSSGIMTSTTPTLTPTTLSNIEQQFIELQSVPTTSHQDRHMQSGFVPPIVDPYFSDSGSQTSVDTDWTPSSGGSKRLKTSRGTAVLSEEDIYTPGYLSTSRRPPTRRKDDKLNPEEFGRRQVRRERNKVAAAKCRQRRVDHTNRLVDETDVLEDEKNDLENEIQSLQQQKEQLEFLLQAHKPLCKMANLDAHPCNANLITSCPSSLPMPVQPMKMDRVNIKSEPNDMRMGQHHSMNRPNTLPIMKKTLETPTCSELGLTMTTPSNGIFTFGLDSMVDGHTGLTPLMSCASQVQRNSSDSSPGDQLHSPTLISL
ncbi:fos-related antigen 1-like isoform X2 [Lineus longissimus]|uniref:fos-related antigen 1-like isoform X2 n=1 Tax=Lineus longissimus TaxID=88925 RepID=UPI00315D836B